MPRLTQPPRLERRWAADVGDHVNALAWSPDGRRLAAASVSGPFAVFDGLTGAEVQRFPGHGFGTASVSWRREGKQVASAGQDGKVRVWDAGTGAELLALDAGAAWAERVAWSPSADVFVSAAGKKVKVWSAAGELVRAYSDQPSTVADVRWQPGGKAFAVAAYGGLALYKPEVDEPVNRLEWKGSALALEWSRDGKVLAAGGQDATVTYWTVKNQNHLQMAGYAVKVRELSFDTTGKYLATGGSVEVTVWDCSGRKGPEGTKPTNLELHAELVSAVAFQITGPLLASGGLDGRVALWSPGTHKKPLAQAEVGSPVAWLAWAAGDARLAVGCESGTVVVFYV